MGGGAYYLACPRVVGVHLHGKLSYGVAAKDIILEVLRRLTVKGGVGKVMEYIGDGVKTLSVPERATITNMGAELGATTSIFPSDEVTHAFLKAQQREQDFVPLSADPDAAYDEILDIDLTALEPLVAKPHMPDIVETVKQCGPIKVDQVFIGSCTNSSYTDMMRVARILKGKTVHPDVSLVIGPGSKQVLTMLARNGALADMIAAGARILESACGPCIGMGQSPRTNAVSVRTNNRNFYGRSGTKSAGIYLVSCETAAVTALTGVLTDPRCLDIDLDIPMPETYTVNDNLVIPPVAPGEEDTVEVVRGPNIQPFPLGKPLADAISGKVLLKMEDHRPHCAVGCEAPAVPLECAVLVGLLPDPRGRDVPGAREEGRRWHPRCGHELRARVEPRTRRACPAVSGYPRCRREVVRPYSSGEPYQQRHSSADVPE